MLKLRIADIHVPVEKCQLTSLIHSPSTCGDKKWLETIEHATVDGANHFFETKLEPLAATVGAYLDKRLAAAPEKG